MVCLPRQRTYQTLEEMRRMDMAIMELSAIRWQHRTRQNLLRLAVQRALQEWRR